MIKMYITAKAGDRNITELRSFAGKVQQFDGVTIVDWSSDEKIFSLREFGSVSAHTLPYGV